MNFSGNLKIIRKLRNVSQQQLAEYLGVKSNTISNYENGISTPDYDLLYKIIKYLDVSVDELLYSGIGDSIKLSPKKNQEDGPELSHKMSPIVSPNVVSIPIVDIAVAAGHGATNGANLEVLDHIQMPAGLVKKGTHLCARIKGDSMAPTLQDGGYIILRLLEKGEWKKQKDEHIYAVTTRDGLAYLKRLKLRFSQGFVVCRSDSPDKSSYPSFNIQADEINTLWYAEWYFTAKMPNIHDQYYQRLQHLEDDVEELKAQFKRING